MDYFGRHYDGELADRIDMRGSVISAPTIADSGEIDCSRDKHVFSGSDPEPMRETLQKRMDCGCAHCLHGLEDFQRRINQRERQTRQTTLADSWA